MTLETDVVLASRDGAVLTLTLNRPERMNAMRTKDFMVIAQHLENAQDDPEVRSVVLRGADGNFCAGADLRSPSASATTHPIGLMRQANRLVTLLSGYPKPTIALVEGNAMGAGCNLALLCDFVVVSPSARFSQVFVKRGLSLDFGGSWILPRLVGLRQAMRLALTGEIVGAEESVSLGLATWLQPADEIEAFVSDLARRLSQGPPVAMWMTKTMLLDSFNQSLSEAVGREAFAAPVNLNTDAPNAIAAFRDRRDPVFTGEWQAR